MVLMFIGNREADWQKMIVAATMCLYNFIHENSTQDIDFGRCNRDTDYVPTILARYRRYLHAGDTSTLESGGRTMDRFRDDLARAISLSRYPERVSMIIWFM